MVFQSFGHQSLNVFEVFNIIQFPIGLDKLGKLHATAVRTGSCNFFQKRNIAGQQGKTDKCRRKHFNIAVQIAKTRLQQRQGHIQHAERQQGLHKNIFQIG